jgi:hypothetical protein
MCSTSEETVNTHKKKMMMLTMMMTVQLYQRKIGWNSEPVRIILELMMMMV